MKMCALHKAPDGTAPAAPQKKKSLTDQPATVSPKPEPVEQTPDTTIPVTTERPVVSDSAQTHSAVRPNEEKQKTENAASGPATDETPTVPGPSAAATNAVPLKTARRVSRGNRVKISEAHLPTEEDTVDLDSLPKDAFSQEHLQKIWHERVNLLFGEKPGILSSLTKHPPILREDHTIELKLDGKHQLEQLQENRATLIEALRKDLNNYSVQLETPVEEVIVVKKAYTPKEIYQSMLEVNPELENLRKTFDLDLDY